MRIRTGGYGATTAALTGAGLCTALALLLTGCGGSDSDGGRPDGGAKNGDTAPRSGGASVPKRPVPRGDGSEVPSDFNGDGHRDLVLNDLVKAPDAIQGDDAGIGIVYGSGSPRGIDPAVRQTLSPTANGAATDGVLPAAFDAVAACDLDGDGFSDLVVSTDPPYDGVGRPPVPLQLLFGGPEGIKGKAVVLKIPEKARHGDDWPDHPVCGDFDGDGETDLAVSATEGRVSHLSGPFTRAGAPDAAAPCRAAAPSCTPPPRPTPTATATTTSSTPPAPTHPVRKPRANSCWAAAGTRRAGRHIHLQGRRAPARADTAGRGRHPHHGPAGVVGPDGRQAPGHRDPHPPGRGTRSRRAPPGGEGRQAGGAPGDQLQHVDLPQVA